MPRPQSFGELLGGQLNRLAGGVVPYHLAQQRRADQQGQFDARMNWFGRQADQEQKNWEAQMEFNRQQADQDQTNWHALNTARTMDDARDDAYRANRLKLDQEKFLAEAAEDLRRWNLNYGLQRDKFEHSVSQKQQGVPAGLLKSMGDARANAWLESRRTPPPNDPYGQMVQPPFTPAALDSLDAMMMGPYARYGADSQPNFIGQGLNQSTISPDDDAWGRAMFDDWDSVPIEQKLAAIRKRNGG